MGIAAPASTMASARHAFERSWKSRLACVGTIIRSAISVDAIFGEAFFYSANVVFFREKPDFFKSLFARRQRARKIDRRSVKFAQIVQRLPTQAFDRVFDVLLRERISLVDFVRALRPHVEHLLRFLPGSRRRQIA